MTNLPMRRRIAALGLLLMVSAPAQALLETCTVTALPVAFGGYNPLSLTPTDSTGDVAVICSGILSIAVNYTISLSAGGAGSYAPRKMAFGAARLNYNLYTNSSRTTVWGDGSGGTVKVSDGYALALLSVTRHYTVYARLPATQNVVAGAYTDTLTVTVNY